MTVGFYSAKAGTISMQRAVDITSNNVANVNTHGFKTHRASFSDLIYTTKLRNDQVETGHGVKIDKGQGALVHRRRSFADDFKIGYSYCMPIPHELQGACIGGRSLL